MFEQPHRLHPAVLIIKFGTYFVAIVRSLAVPLLATLFSGKHKTEDFYVLWVGGAFALFGVLSLVGTVLHYVSTSYCVKGGSLEIQSGVIWKKNSTIPLARIQNVNVERTIWHRLLGAAAVKIETAAGKKGEGDLAALSLDDANRMQAVLLQHAHEQVETVEEKPKPEVLYSLTFRQILLSGALGNRVMYIIASMFAVFQSHGLNEFMKPMMNMIEKMNPAMAGLVAALSMVGMFIIGWIVSIVISATRYYGFKIERHDKGLLLSHGLITQFRTIVPVGRIQDVRVVEPILYRTLGYCEIYADTAGSFDAKDAAGANKICPLVPVHNAESIGKLLLPEFTFESLWWNSVSSKTVLRHMWRYLFVWSIILAWPLGKWLGWHAFWALIPIAILSWVTGYFAFRFVGYAWTSDILAARSGVFRKKTTIIPFDRIQHYSVHATWPQRMLGLCSVTAVSAAMGAHPIHIVDVPKDAADRLRATIGEAIRSHLGGRKGGL